ncbi:chalcone isomerase family protein [Alcanivorax sp. JB21]|uniref:chalcone isomerase family protein n=1 Tax=Alcanivorax limicola TaxID=2874102 RepID=UPI001CC10E39|nr:chalcone isomerase family protein [Alcanivorax limicola]MBZ2188530.1 chalcone isomerase family protein [Alcanivorax limicola]
MATKEIAVHRIVVPQPRQRTHGLQRLCFIVMLLVGSMATAATLPETITVDDITLTLNGEGQRNKYLMNVYVAGLYLQSREQDAEEIIRRDEVQAVQLTITSSRVTQKRFMDSIEDGFRKSAGDDYPDYAPFLAELREDMADIDIKDGDVFRFIYRPDEGTRFLRNDETLRVIEGLDFKQVLFGIYLGKDPVQDSLKRDMLGR